MKTKEIIEEIIEIMAQQELRLVTSGEDDQMTYRIRDLELQLAERAEFFQEIILETELIVAENAAKAQIYRIHAAGAEARGRRATAVADRFRQFWIPQMIDATKDGKELKVKEGTWKLRESVSLNVTDEKKIPKKFLVPKMKVLGTEVKKALIAGESVTGAELVTKRRAYLS